MRPPLLLALCLTACFVDDRLPPVGATASDATTSTVTSGSATDDASTGGPSTGGASTGASTTSTDTGDATGASSTSTDTGTTGECVDADTDTHCDDVDNCPKDANVDQADGDRDGLGDVCDPCLHDGPNPPTYAASVGPIKEITISDASLDGLGNFITVTPGATVSVAYHWAVNFCECSGCVTQGMVGIVGHPPGQCFYNAGKDMNCMTQEGDVVQDFVAPTEPGVHPIRAIRTYEYACTTDLPLEDPSVEFAALCVN